MSADDFDVIVYKALSYVYACIKAGAIPSVDKAQEVAGCNDVYWASAVRSMLADGYIMGASVDCEYTGAMAVTAGPGFGITQKGAQYLRDNSKMREAARFLGKAFEKVLDVAVKATLAMM